MPNGVVDHAAGKQRSEHQRSEEGLGHLQVGLLTSRRCNQFQALLRTTVRVSQTLPGEKASSPKVVLLHGLTWARAMAGLTSKPQKAATGPAPLMAPEESDHQAGPLMGQLLQFGSPWALGPRFGRPVRRIAPRDCSATPMDARLLLVATPVLLAVGWAAFNIGRAAVGQLQLLLKRARA